MPSNEFFLQFQADVSLPSMQLPASKKLSAPDPSKALRKKSTAIDIATSKLNRNMQM